MKARSLHLRDRQLFSTDAPRNYSGRDRYASTIGRYGGRAAHRHLRLTATYSSCVVVTRYLRELWACVELSNVSLSDKVPIISVFSTRPRFLCVCRLANRLHRLGYESLSGATVGLVEANIQRLSCDLYSMVGHPVKESKRGVPKAAKLLPFSSNLHFA